MNRTVDDDGLVRCGDCHEPLVAKTRSDGTIETWHRDEPCPAPYIEEDRAFARSVKALRRRTGYRSPGNRVAEALSNSWDWVSSPAVWRTPAILPPAPVDPDRPRS